MLEINEERLLKNIEKSSAIGATVNQGLNRLTLTKEDMQMRDVYMDLLEKANVEVRVDDFGNMYGRREGKNNNAPPVTFGSHLDTQPSGGRFDGILGVLAGLEVIETLNDSAIITDYPLEIINFTNEEGARYNPPLLGSGALTGKFSKEYVYGLKDSNQITFEQALNDAAYMGMKANRLKAAANYVELHIEQGPILEREGKNIGIVHGIQGLTRINVKVIGLTNHAGGARMEGRKDALLVASHMIIAANKITQEIEGLRITVGKIDNYPNVINVIPGVVEFVVDVRHEQDRLKNDGVLLVQERLKQIAVEHSVQCETYLDWAYDTVDFDQRMVKSIERVTKSLAYSSMDIYSGPGHDAKYMSTFTPTAMIFVPSVDGISHNEKEWTKDEDVIKGANVLLHTILQLANNGIDI